MGEFDEDEEGKNAFFIFQILGVYGVFLYFLCLFKFFFIFLKRFDTGNLKYHLQFDTKENMDSSILNTFITLWIEIVNKVTENRRKIILAKETRLWCRHYQLIKKKPMA